MSPFAQRLRERLSLEPGRIALGGYRMVMLSACALGALRKELIETLGWEAARGVLKRFGQAAGLGDGVALLEQFDQLGVEEQLGLGPALHALEGIARVVRIPEGTEIDLARGRYRVEGYWEQSYEAEQHLELFGVAGEPVCWTLAGYATGHATAAANRRILVVETECRAMGHDRCRFVADRVEALADQARVEEPDYRQNRLPLALDQLLEAVTEQQRTLELRADEIQRLESELSEVRTQRRLVGRSRTFTAVLETARTVAPVDTTVLILGESGTGKEGIARSIHDQSLRRNGPFVAVNSSAIPESLQEAELFGFVAGAFTGAVADTPGIFEAANGGTLFLDEIGDLSLSAQTKILRALQQREIKRVGESQSRPIDVRVIAATHRDLERMIADRTFREDLYYRLSVITIAVPPLRNRDEDAILLAEHFLDRAAKRFDRPRRPLSADAIAFIQRHDWPGNVRELEHAIERAVILGRRPKIHADDLGVTEASVRAAREGVGSGDGGSEPAGPNSPPARDDEAAALREAIAAADGNRTRAARLLGISRTTLWRRMKAAGLLD